MDDDSVILELHRRPLGAAASDDEIDSIELEGVEVPVPAGKREAIECQLTTPECRAVDVMLSELGALPELLGNHLFRLYHDIEGDEGTQAALNILRDKAHAIGRVLSRGYGRRNSTRGAAQ